MKNLLFLTLVVCSQSVFAQSWKELGIGSNSLNVNAMIKSICVDPAENVYAAGNFTNAKGNYYVAKWDGTKWSELGSDTNALNATSYINSICSDSAGNIYAAGNFVNTTGVRYVAKWNGTNWAELKSDSSSLLANGIIYTIYSDKKGNIYAGGGFTDTASGNVYVAKWNGTAWTGLINSSVPLGKYGTIHTLTTSKAGTLYAAGSFVKSSYSYVAKWNGIYWEELGAGLNADGAITTICADKLGNVYAAGMFGSKTLPYHIVAKWNGSNWSELATAQLKAWLEFWTMCTDEAGNVYAAGNLYDTLGHRYVAKWDGTNWTALQGSGTDTIAFLGTISSICAGNSGDIYSTCYRNNRILVARYTNRVGIKDISGTSTFQVYPNPADDNIFIQFNNTKVSKITLCDNAGRVVYQNTNTLKIDQLNINIEHLAKGVYYLNLLSDESSITKKIVVY